MSVLEARGIGVTWSASVPVMRDVSFVLTPGFYGLVGANGAGKTTLLRVVLDEPTNHLDLPTIERLEQALADYPGCIVLVTHDDDFASAVTTRTLSVEHGTVS